MRAECMLDLQFVSFGLVRVYNTHRIINTIGARAYTSIREVLLQVLRDDLIRVVIICSVVNPPPSLPASPS